MIDVKEWPLKDRIWRCLDVMESMDNHKNIQMFYPTPLLIKTSLASAREALELLLEPGAKND